MRKQTWPAHLNCPHYWDTHPKGKVNCDELWLGAPLRDWWEKELGQKGGASSGNWGHAGRPGLVGGSGGTGGVRVYKRGDAARDEAKRLVAEVTGLRPGQLQEEGWHGFRGVIAEKALQDAIERVGRPSAVLVVVGDGSETVGVASVMSGPGIGEMEILHCATKRSGHGRALLEGIAKYAMDNGQGIALDAAPDAITFYEHMGMRTAFGSRFYWTLDDLTSRYKEMLDVDEYEPEDGVFVDGG